MRPPGPKNVLGKLPYTGSAWARFPPPQHKLLEKEVRLRTSILLAWLLMPDRRRKTAGVEAQAKSRAGCPILPGPAFLRHHPNASVPEIGGL